MQSVIDFIAGWCVRENKPPSIAAKMITMYNDDVEFWSQRMMWDLYDRIQDDN